MGGSTYEYAGYAQYGQTHAPDSELRLSLGEQHPEDRQAAQYRQYGDQY